jgi:intracellular sulfur oxidation DsrE/DsrF family protein
MQIRYLLGRNSKLKTNSIRRSINSQMHNKRVQGMTKYLVATFAALSLLITGTVFGNSSYDKQKVVYHVNYSDGKRAIGAMRNAQNHINALGQDNYEIQFVLHGNGIELLRSVAQNNQDAAGRIDSLRGQGVDFKICANTLKGRKIALDDLYFAEKSDVVPSGVAEIGKLQQQGFVYLRP